MNQPLSELLERMINILTERIPSSESAQLKSLFDKFQSFATKTTDDIFKPDYTNERKETYLLLKELCQDYGDNNWDEELAIPDIIEKHFSKHLYQNHPPDGKCV